MHCSHAKLSQNSKSSHQVRDHDDTHTHTHYTVSTPDLQCQQHQGLPSTCTPLASSTPVKCLQQHFLSTSLVNTKYA